MTNKLTVVWVASTNPHKLNELQAILSLLKRENAFQQEIIFKTPVNLIDVPETGLTFLDNARLKAEYFVAEQFVKNTKNTHSLMQDWVLAEDSGLIIPALRGTYGYDPFPGIFSNRWMNLAIREELLSVPMNSDIPSHSYSQKITDIDKNCGILALLNNQNLSREASYACAMSLWRLQTEMATAYGEMPLQVRNIDAKTVLNESTQAAKKNAPRGFGYDPIMLSKPTMRCLSQMSIEEKSAISHRAAALRQLMQIIKESS